MPAVASDSLDRALDRAIVGYRIERWLARQPAALSSGVEAWPAKADLKRVLFADNLKNSPKFG